MLNTIAHFFSEYGVAILGIASLVFTILSGFASSIAGRVTKLPVGVPVAKPVDASLIDRLRRTATPDKGIRKPPDKGPEEPAGEISQIQLRLNEVRNVLGEQNSNANKQRWADSSLVVAQYIVGGAITSSSFLQQNLRPAIIGCLGLMVLLSSLTRQKFRPDLKFHSAKRRVVRLRALVRSGEDQLALLKASNPDALTASKALALLSDGLKDIEASEVDDEGNAATES